MKYYDFYKLSTKDRKAGKLVVGEGFSTKKNIVGYFNEGKEFTIYTTNARGESTVLYKTQDKEMLGILVSDLLGYKLSIKDKLKLQVELLKFELFSHGAYDPVMYDMKDECSEDYAFVFNFTKFGKVLGSYFLDEEAKFPALRAPRGVMNSEFYELVSAVKDGIGEINSREKLQLLIDTLVSFYGIRYATEEELSSCKEIELDIYTPYIDLMKKEKNCYYNEGEYIVGKYGKSISGMWYKPNVDPLRLRELYEKFNKESSTELSLKNKVFY